MRWLISLNGGSSEGTPPNISANFAIIRLRTACNLFSDSRELLGDSGAFMTWTRIPSPPSRGELSLPWLRRAFVCEGAVLLDNLQCEVHVCCPSEWGTRTCSARFFASMRSSCPEVIIVSCMPRILRVSWSKLSTSLCFCMNGVPIIISYQSILTTSKYASLSIMGPSSRHVLAP